MGSILLLTFVSTILCYATGRPVQPEIGLVRKIRSLKMSNTWKSEPNNTIFIIIDKSFDRAETEVLIKPAIHELEKYSCMNFVMLEPNQVRKEGGASMGEMGGETNGLPPQTISENYIFIRKSYDYCRSSVGQTGGEQNIYLDDRCRSKTNTMHEIMHSLGAGHQQSRPDRNDYVKIHYENIIKGWEQNFDVLENTTTLGPFDFESIMLYPKYTHSKNNRLLPTTTSLVPGWDIPTDAPQSLSTGDMFTIAALTCGEDMHPSWTYSYFKPARLTLEEIYADMAPG